MNLINWIAIIVSTCNGKYIVNHITGIANNKFCDRTAVAVTRLNRLRYRAVSLTVQVAVDVVLDEGQVVPLRQAHQGAFVGLRHQATEGILEVRNQQRGRRDRIDGAELGHGLEGDFNRKGASAFSGKIGQQVASEKCTVVDDGTLAGRRGSLAVDDEGTPGQFNVLIESGILKGYMQDKMNARLMGVQPTGNGRRESFAHIPMPRMTNTYMLAGPHAPGEIIASVDKGLYAPNFGGGQVDITSGKFVFSASEAYLIENGKVTTPVKGAMLIGDGPEALHKISMVGNDLQLDTGVGTCGKEGQSVPVGVGQPTMLVDELTVGGTST